MEEDYAVHNYLIQVTTNDVDMVNNFGYRQQEKFNEDIRRKIMVALADFPYLTCIEISPIDLSALTDNMRALSYVEEEEEFYEDEDDIL